MAATEDSEETSHWSVSRRAKGGPSSVRMERTFWRAVSRAGAEMSVMRTEAPSRAKRTVVSRPMPLGTGWKVSVEVRRIDSRYVRGMILEIAKGMQGRTSREAGEVGSKARIALDSSYHEVFMIWKKMITRTV